MKNNEYSLALLCDFYELTMGRGYFDTDKRNTIAYFDVFFRRVPDGGGYAITAGLEQIVHYIENLSFTEADIEFLRGKGIFSEEFLKYLAEFKFTGDIWGVPEGSVIFPGEPILTVRAPVIQAQLVETYVLLSLNHQSLIARLKADPYPSSVQEERTEKTRRYTEQELHISADAPELPAHFPISSTEFPRAAQWLIRGFRCSTMNTKPSLPIADSTRTILRSL